MRYKEDMFETGNCMICNVEENDLILLSNGQLVKISNVVETSSGKKFDLYISPLLNTPITYSKIITGIPWRVKVKCWRQM